jgi:hypothetical protein
MSGAAGIEGTSPSLDAYTMPRTATVLQQFVASHKGSSALMTPQSIQRDVSFRRICGHRYETRGCRELVPRYTTACLPLFLIRHRERAVTWKDPSPE